MTVSDEFAVSVGAVAVAGHTATADARSADVNAGVDVFAAAVESWQKVVEVGTDKTAEDSVACEYNTAVAVKQEAPLKSSAAV